MNVWLLVIGNWLLVKTLYIFRSFRKVNFQVSVGRGRARSQKCESYCVFVLLMSLIANAKRKRNSAKMVQLPRGHLGNCDVFNCFSLIFLKITSAHGGSDEIPSLISRFRVIALFTLSIFFTLSVFCLFKFISYFFRCYLIFFSYLCTVR